MIETLHVSDICQAAYLAEQTGDYETGLLALSEFWDYRYPDRKPNLPEEITKEVADLLLRSGALYGFYGYFFADSPKEYQEKSKNLVTDAFMYYQQLGLDKFRFQLRECALYLAIAYSRSPNQENTLTWLDYALSSKEIDSIYLKALILEANINISAKENEKVIERLEAYGEYFRASDDYLLKGNYYNNLGIALKNMGDFDAAIDNLQKGLTFFGKLNHRVYLIASLNNIAFLYHRKGLATNPPGKPKHDLLSKVFGYLTRALGIAEDLDSNRQIGDIWDTHAIVAFEVDNFVLSLHYAEKAVAYLEKTECHGTFVSALETRMKNLIRLGRLGDALDDYRKACGIAEIHLDSPVLSRLKGAMVSQSNEVKIIKIYREGSILTFMTDVNLSFDPRIKIENEISAVETTSNRSRFIGVEAGDFLIVEDGPVKEGDLVAVLTSSKEVFTGFLRINELKRRISLRSPHGIEWLDFNIMDGTEKTTKLGKIVGKARLKRNFSKHLFVEPVEINPEDFDKKAL